MCVHAHVSACVHSCACGRGRSDTINICKIITGLPKHFNRHIITKKKKRTQMQKKERYNISHLILYIRQVLTYLDNIGRGPRLWNISCHMPSSA